MSLVEDFPHIDIIIRDTVFAGASPEDKFTWDIGEPMDVSDNEVGHLFRQEDPFFLIETDISSVHRAGPGMDSRRRVQGALLISYLTKNQADRIVALTELGRMASLFGDSTIDGIRFRQYQPVGSTQMMGFMSYDSAIPFDLELRPMRG